MCIACDNGALSFALGKERGREGGREGGRDGGREGGGEKAIVLIPSPSYHECLHYARYNTLHAHACSYNISRGTLN